MNAQVKSLVSNQFDLEDIAKDIHQAVGTWIIHATPDDNIAFNQLIERLQQIDSRLAMELEDAANCRTATAMENAFRLGFLCAKRPETLLFSEG